VPERERQVRPLVGLKFEEGKVAWERAIQKAGGRKITARLVRASVQKLQAPPIVKPEAHNATRRFRKGSGMNIDIFLIE
jgi:hypothetical protein